MSSDQQRFEQLRGEIRKLDVDLAAAIQAEKQFGLTNLNMAGTTLAQFTTLKTCRNALVNRRNQLLGEFAALKMTIYPEVQHHG